LQADKIETRVHYPAYFCLKPSVLTGRLQVSGAGSTLQRSLIGCSEVFHGNFGCSTSPTKRDSKKMKP